MQADHHEQPMPVRNDRPSIQGMVRDDLAERERVGIERYGTPLQAGNGRDAMRDAYEEALDLATYLRQVIEERSLAVPAIAEVLTEHQPHRLLSGAWQCRCLCVASAWPGMAAHLAEQVTQALAGGTPAVGGRCGGDRRA